MTRKALIVGLGISGIAAAIGLKKQGWDLTIIEKTPERRTGGYFIGLREDGKQAARTLGALQFMPNRTPANAQFWDIDKNGSRKAIRDITNESNAPLLLLRGDIEESLWKALGNQVEVRFNTVPVSILNNPNGVSVGMRTGEEDERTEDFDLLIGADGVRSTVRRLCFGEDDQFLKPVGTSLCAFPLSGQLTGFKHGEGIIIAETGRSLTVFPLADRPPTALFSYRRQGQAIGGNKLPAEELRKIFEGLDHSGIISSVLDDLSDTQDYVFDSVNRVKMSAWSDRRVVLLGDSAWCLTLYSGMGASAGMMGAVALATAIEAYPEDLTKALAHYENAMRPFVKKHQRFIALRSQLFVPSSPAFMVLRKLLWKILTKFSG